MLLTMFLLLPFRSPQPKILEMYFWNVLDEMFLTWNGKNKIRQEIDSDIILDIFMAVSKSTMIQSVSCFPTFMWAETIQIV